MVQREKRRAPRVAARESRGQLKATVPVTILNVSAVGLLLELASPLRPGSTYDLRATISGVPLTVNVRITRCRAGGYAEDGKGGRSLLFHAGGEFVGLEGAQLEMLRRAIEAAGPDSADRVAFLRPTSAAS